MLLSFHFLGAQHSGHCSEIVASEGFHPQVWLQQKGFARFGIQLTAASKQSRLYAITYRNIPIYGCQLAVLKGKIRSVVTASFPWSDSFISTNLLPEIWFPDTALHAYFPAKIEKQGGIAVYRNLNGNGAVTLDERRFLQKDSSIKVKIFAPDPITATGTTYGNPLRDWNDSSNALLQAAMTEVEITCLFDADSFHLQTPLLRFSNISNPDMESGVYKSLDFDRSDPGFEELNVYFHLQELAKWWTALGFPDYADTVQVDAHAFEGLDESLFNPLLNPPSIEFGTGGVDDAEDADAIVHEYTHAAFHAIVPSGYAGSQRQAVEEGICDFVAVAYSNLYSAHQSSWVYNWDGHNEFWNGRNLVNNKVYPASITNFPHQDGELFGAALYSLSQELGYDTTLKLLFSAMPLFVSGISMTEAAALILKTDSVLFDAEYRWPVIKAFYPKGLLASLHTDTHVVSKQFEVLNSAAFARGDGNLVLYSSKPLNIQVFDVCGRMVYEYSGKSEKIELNPHAFKSGMYVVKMGDYSVKIVKF